MLPVLFYYKRGIKNRMIQVTKEEAMEIRKRLRHETVTVCNKQAASRKKSYYAPTSYAVMRLLQDMRSKQNIEHYE